VARICKSCGEAYADDRNVCSIDGQPLDLWTAAAEQAMAETVTAARSIGAHRHASSEEPAPTPATDLRVGRTLAGRYLLEEEIGIGGFGVVFRARDERLQKRVAVKVLSPQFTRRADMLARFHQEAVAAGHIGHPGIVDVTDFDREADGTWFLVMEYLDGRDLSRVIEKEAPLPPARALAITAQVADAIAAAHDKGIVHRDLKPANIYVLRRDEQVKVLDFGISKMTANDAEPHALTGIGQILGTPYYISPEQARGDAVIDGRSDVYSLGIILYELLTRKRPFVATTYLGVITLHLTQSPALPSTIVSLPAELDALVLRALEKAPEQRFASMKAFGAAMREVAAELPHLPAAGRPALLTPTPAGEQRPASITDIVRAPEKRALRAWLLVAAVVVAGVGAWAVRRQGGGSVVKPSAPMALTHLGACELAPAFLDERTVAFELDRDGQSHLYSLNIEGRVEPLAITSGALSELTVSLGRHAGEILYRVEDPKAQTRIGGSHVALRDLGTGAETRLELPTSAATAVGDVIYYARADHGEIRRVRKQIDEVFLPMPADLPVAQIVASDDGQWLALEADVAHGAPRLCLVNLGGTPELRCPKALRPVRGRVSFSPDARAVYYPAADGLHRYERETEQDRVILPGVFARGGLAVSPSGGALVFSDCRARGPLLDFSQSPPRVAIDDDLPREPAAGPRGMVAYVRERNGQRVLVMRDAQGIARELTTVELGSPSSPAFDATGQWLAFQLVGADKPGIYFVATDGGYPSQSVTVGLHDTDPIFTSDGRIAFTRWDDQHNPYVHVVAREGGTPERASLPPRQTAELITRTGELLLTSKDKRQLFLWNPATGRERSVALGPLEGSYLMSAGISDDGKYLVAQVGTSGRTVWRLWLDGRPPERLYEAKPVESMSSVALTTDGRILVGVRSWQGELFVVRAPAGQHF
jgi:tRNA A-37 threonylcarbamoyl transferase component Bud32